MTTNPTVGEKYVLMAEINMIPLIDVSLVILIIFMVLTPALVRSQIAVNLPQAETAAPQRNEVTDLVVSIDRAGAVSIDGAPVAAAQLPAAFQLALQGRPDRLVILEADRGVAFQHVVGVMDVAKKSGAGHLAVAALKE